MAATLRRRRLHVGGGTATGQFLGFRRARCGGLATAGGQRRLEELTFICLRVELRSRCPLRACVAQVPPALGVAPLMQQAPDFQASQRHVHGALRRTLDCGTYSGRCVWPNVRAKLPAEAGFVSPVRDDSTTGADRAYKACRSGSA